MLSTQLGSSDVIVFLNHPSSSLHVWFRSPAWCDRILWRSIPNLMSSNNGLTQTALFAAQDVMTSDHKPVTSLFRTLAFTMPVRLLIAAHVVFPNCLFMPC